MNLTAWLLVVGVLVLLALLLQGWLNTRRAAPRRDALLGTAPGAPGAAGEPGGRVEPALGELAPLPAADVRASALRRSARLDALIDAIAPLTLEAPVSGEFVLAHLPPTRRAGTKPFYVEGLDVASGDWQPAAAGQRYSELQAGVQLAGRSGALNEIEYSEFVQKVQEFADAVGAMADFPDMLDVVARARELDGLAAPLDAQLSVTLRAKAASWSINYLQQAAARHGFVPGALPGRLVLPAAEDGAPPVLVLSFDAQAALADEAQRAVVRDCVLTLDVPQTDARAEPFPAWHRTATALADDMDAATVDAHGQPVTLHAFAAIGRDLEQLYAQLQALDLAAGSAAARRVFS